MPYPAQHATPAGHVAAIGWATNPLALQAEYGRLWRCVADRELAPEGEDVVAYRMEWTRLQVAHVQKLGKQLSEQRARVDLLKSRLRAVCQRLYVLEVSQHQREPLPRLPNGNAPPGHPLRLYRSARLMPTGRSHLTRVTRCEREVCTLSEREPVEHPRAAAWVDAQMALARVGKFRPGAEAGLPVCNDEEEDEQDEQQRLQQLRLEDGDDDDDSDNDEEEEEEDEDDEELLALMDRLIAVTAASEQGRRNAEPHRVYANDLRSQQLLLQQMVHMTELEYQAIMAVKITNDQRLIEQQRVTHYYMRMQQIKAHFRVVEPDLDLDADNLWFDDRRPERVEIVDEEEPPVW